MTERDYPFSRGAGQAFVDVVERAEEAPAVLRRTALAHAALAHLFDEVVRAPLETEAAKARIDAVEVADGAFDYLPVDLVEFLALMIELDELLGADPDYVCADAPYRPVHVLEIGCGPGRNLFVLKASNIVLWSRLEGFDILAPYVELGREIFGFTDELRVGDAMAEEYAQADVMFFYRPFSDDAAQAAFETRLLSQMKRGAYLVAVSAESIEATNAIIAKGGSGAIWKKIA